MDDKRALLILQIAEKEAPSLGKSPCRFDGEARRCTECKRLGLDHTESDPCLYPRFFPNSSSIEQARAKQDKVQP